jgi:hypothetical protein
MNQKYLKYKIKYLEIKNNSLHPTHLTGGMKFLSPSYWFPKFKTDQIIYFIDVNKKKSNKASIQTVNSNKLYDIFYGGKIYKDIHEDLINEKDDDEFQLRVWYYSYHNKDSNEISYNNYIDLLSSYDQDMLNTFLLEYNINKIITKYYKLDIIELQKNKSLFNLFDLFEWYNYNKDSNEISYNNYMDLLSKCNNNQDILNKFLLEHNINIIISKYYELEIAELQKNKDLLNDLKIVPLGTKTVEIAIMNLLSKPNICRNLVQDKLKEFGKNVEYIKPPITANAIIPKREFVNITLDEYEKILNSINENNQQIKFTREELNKCLRKYNVVINSYIIQIWLKSVNNSPTRTDYNEFIEEISTRFIIETSMPNSIGLQPNRRGLKKITKEEIDLCLNLLGITIIE